MNECNFVDIHTHILPGIDDGADNMDIAFDMMNKEYNEGVRAIVLTPHFGAYNPDFNLNKAEEVFQKLRRKAEEKFSDLKLYLGNEILYSPGIVEALSEGKAKTLAGTDYVLVEFPYKEEYRNIEKAVQTLVINGYRPILAHVERYEELVKDIDLVEELIDRGAYIQINANSLSGGFFDKKFGFCKKLLKYDLVHFVATDCHNMKTRKPAIKEAIEKLETIIESDQIKEILCENPEKLLKNEDI